MDKQSYVRVHISGPQSCRSRVAKVFPILQWLPAYDARRDLMHDCIGGVIIGFVLVAQSVAHAELSKVELIHGPYSCMVPPLVYMAIGTSRHGSVGTGGLVALLTGTELARYATLELRTRAASVLALMVGAILVLMGALRLSGLVRFMSRPALGGFVTGSALLIIASQLPSAMGAPSSRLLDIVSGLSAGHVTVHAPTVALSALILAFLLGMPHLKKQVKILARLSEFKELMAMAAATVLCAAAGDDLGIVVVGDVPRGLPRMSLPSPSRGMALELVPGALALAVVVFVSSFAAAKQISMQGGYQIDATNELLGLGFANAAGALFGAIPTQIGLSRTGIAWHTGVKTQLGVSFVTAAVIAIILLACTPLIHHMPRCVLNCVIMAAAKGISDYQMPFQIYRVSVNRRDLKDLCVWLTAFFLTVALGPTSGMFCAMSVSLVLLILEVAEPNLAVLTRAERGGGGRWRSSSDFLADQGSPSILVIRVDGALFYANAERFQEQVEEIERAREQSSQPVRAIILDLSCTPFVDFTFVQVLEEMAASLGRRRMSLRVANAVGRTRNILEKDLSGSIGQRSFFVDVQEAYDELMGLQYEAPRLHSNSVDSTPAR